MQQSWISNVWLTSSVIKLCDDSSFLKAAGDEVLDSTPGVSSILSEDATTNS